VCSLLSIISFFFTTLAARGGHAALDNSSGIDVYHGYFSFLLGGCPLSSWKSNSALIHAVADKPSGPFKPSGQSVYPKVVGVDAKHREAAASYSLTVLFPSSPV
jgi:hypothetical protein